MGHSSISLNWRSWKSNPALGSRFTIVIALLFVAFAAYGIGLEADLWCLVLVAAGLAIRTAMRWLNSRGGALPAGTSAESV